MSLKAVIDKLIYEAHLTSLGFRRALRSAIVVFLSVFIYRYFSLTQGYWVALTAVIVVQSTIGATLRKSLQRFLGTLLGVSIASLLLLWIHQPLVIDCLAIVFLFVTYFFNPYTNLINYGLVVVPVSITVVFLIAMVSPEKINSGIILARFYDTMLGAALGILGALFLFPNKVKWEFNTSKKYLEQQLADYFVAIMNMFLNMPGAQAQAKSKKMYVETALLCDRQFYLERIYEMQFKSSQREAERQFIESSERIAQRLFSLHHQARYHLDCDKFEKIPEMLLKLRDTGFDFLKGNLNAVAPLTALLEEMQSYLAEMKTGWQEIAPFAGIQLVMAGLIQDVSGHLRQA